MINTDSSDWIEIATYIKAKRESAIVALLNPNTDDRLHQYYRGIASLAAELLTFPEKQNRAKP